MTQIDLKQNIHKHRTANEDTNKNKNNNSKRTTNNNDNDNNNISLIVEYSPSIFPETEWDLEPLGS